MPPTALETPRPAPAAAGAEPGVRPDPPAPDWADLARLLAATDEDELPLVGRLPA